jgi:hypothetical protein
MIACGWLAETLEGVGFFVVISAAGVGLLVGLVTLNDVWFETWWKRRRARRKWARKG